MVFLYNLTMPEIVIRVIAALIFAGLHGALWGSLLQALGDRTPAEQGRLSINPFNHIALSGIFMAIMFRTSWISPLPQHRQSPWWRPLLAVVLCLGIELMLVPLLDLARPLLHENLNRASGEMALLLVEALQNILVGAVVINLLPLPGLAMGAAVPAIFPALAKRYRKSVGLGMAAAAILLILGWFPDLRPMVRWLQLI